ncbi:carbon starvation protein A [Bacillus aerolatus]|uniref:Carbon starvation protein A n=1 Tax=Bacillus aerolatus TaxID=2653354 RepID=A0A6I1FFW9_9BACI|nr:carbon starvation protein A [Bacillus aerolatus]KAB7704223.1 carbon starvation protein A [Bacillus aerolatus]
MNLLTLLAVSGIIFVIAYFTYGKFLERKLGVDPKRPTPALTMADGVDYVAAKKPVLLGHHFATIAGGGPIVGPVTAVVFGWIPAVIWIIVGSIFIGGVHDFASLQASLRHRAQSIGTIIKEYMGKRGQTLFLAFSIATLILIVGVFIILVKDTFIAVPEAATASVLFIGAAIAFGLLVNVLRMNFVLASALGVVAMGLSIWAGVNFPLELGAGAWITILLVYAYLASVMPVWVLLQPRDYLNSFLLYGMIAGAALGIIIANPEIKMAGYTGFHNETLGFLFPILFITIACGAVSGFHSLVSSGTTAKQIDNEKNGRFITYGSMLLEGFLAIIAIGAVAYLSQADFTARMTELGGPIGTFSAGVGFFMSHLGIPEVSATTFTALTASAFLMTTLDSATRLGKYAVQEFAESRSEFFTNNHVSTLVIVAGAGALAISGTWSSVWPLFGSANQMLGAIALLAISVWLIKTGVKAWFTIIPMIFMFIVTLAALLSLLQTNFVNGNYFLAVSAFVLFVLCIVLIIEAWRALTTADEDTSVKI